MNEAQNDSARALTERDVMQIWNLESGGLLKEVPMPRCLRVSRRKMRGLVSCGVEIQVCVCLCVWPCCWFFRG